MAQHHRMTTTPSPSITVAEYLRRVSYVGPTDPTVEVLGEIVAAHNRSIPFENLDPVMGV